MRIWFTLHRWLGRVLAPLLAVLACSGLVLLWLQPLPASGPPPPAEQLGRALDQALQTLGAGQPALVLVYADLPRGDGPLRLRLAGQAPGVPPHWAEVDAASGRVLDLRAHPGGLKAWLYDLHHQLLLGDAGGGVPGTVAVPALLSLAVGLRLWLRVRRLRAPSARRRWHRRVGIAMVLPMACTLVTGVMLSWPDAVGAALRHLDREVAASPPGAVAPVVGGPALSPGAALVVGARALPAALPTRIHAARDGAHRVRLLQDEWHPIGLNAVQVAAAGGAVVRTVRWRELPPSALLAGFAYPLHIGGWSGSPGLAGVLVARVLWSAIALALLWLAWSGLPGRRVAR